MSSLLMSLALKLGSSFESDRHEKQEGFDQNALAGCSCLQKGLELLAVFVLLACFFLTAPQVLAQTSVSGAVAVDTRWTVADGPYLVIGDVVVQNGAVLTIDPGVTVYMAPSTSLTVQTGSLNAKGTASSPVLVLSDKTRLAQAAAPGDWKQWVFTSGCTNTRLDFVRFENGSGLSIKGAAPILNYLDLRNHRGAAITMDLAASPSGVGNQASGNTINGIEVPAGAITKDIKWGVRGIPYVVSMGTLSVGVSPSVESVSPSTIQQGDTVTVNVTGTRLSGLTDVRFDSPGITAQVLPGATDSQASLAISVGASVPAGSIRMRMLVNAGEVEIPSAFSLVQPQPVLTGFSPSTLYTGQGTVDLTINGRNFSNQTVAWVNGVAVPTLFQSATQLKARITALDVASDLKIKLQSPDPINAGQFLSSNELSLPVKASQLTLAPTSVTATKGVATTFTASLPYPAPTGGVSINLVSSVPTIATVPASLVVPEGQTSVTFQLTPGDLGSTVLTASKVGFVSGQAQVTVVPPPALTFNPASVILGVGRTSELTIKSSVPAGSSGLLVNLSSSNTAVATTPASATIQAGASSATVTVSSVATGSAVIRAQATDFISGDAAVTVRPVSLNMPSGALVAPGLTRSIPITLSDPAPEGGLVITLTSSDSQIASVAASISVPAGQTSANFVLTGLAAGVATINAAANGYQPATTTVTVEAVTISIGNPAVSSISLPEESSRAYVITLSRPAPAGGVVITLNTADASKATVAPSIISISEGQTSGGVVLASITGVAKGSTTFVASAPGLSTANVPVSITGKAGFVFASTAVSVGKGLKTYVNEVSIQVKSDGVAYAPNQPLVVNLASSDPSKVSVPATVTIPAGSSSAYFYVTGVDFTNGVPVTIDASVAGYSAPATKLAVNVVAPTFTFVSLDTNRSPGSIRDNFYIQVYTPGSSYSGNQTAASDIPINLEVVESTPSGLVDGFYSVQTGGSAINQVVLRQGTYRTYENNGYTYVGTPSSGGSYKVQASATGITSATSPLVTVNTPELKFSAGVVTVGKGLKTYVNEVYVYRAVNGTAISGVEALTLNLTSNDPSKVSVPATVTIPAGSSSAYFYVTGVDFTNGVPVTIDASVAGYSAPATKLAVNVVAPTFTFVSLDTNRSPVSARDDFYIQVYTPGSSYSGNQTAASDIPINLEVVESTPSGLVDGFYSAQTGGSAINQVILRQGTYRTYENNGYTYVGTPTAAGSYKVRANATGIASATSALVTANAPELRFAVTGGGTVVTVGKGLKTYINEVYVYRAVNGTATNGAEALTLNLSSNDPSKVSVPATVTIPAGSSSAYFYVTGIDFTNGTPVTLDASASGYSAPTTKLPVNVVAPTFSFISLDTNRSPASVRDDFYIQVSVPGSYYSSSQIAAADMPINLNVIDSTEGIVDGFYSAQTGGSSINQVILRQGNTNTYYGNGYAYVGVPTAAGSYKVQASAEGIASAASVLVTVKPPELRFANSNGVSITNIVVGKGLKTYTYEVRVDRAVNGVSFNGSQALTVNLSCSSTAICTVPASVTIPAGQSSVYFSVEGVGLGNATITASASGYSSSQDLAVNVTTPQLVISTPASVAVGGKATVSVYLSVSGAIYSANQTAAGAITVNLTSSAPGIASVPDSVTIPIGSSSSTGVQLTGGAVGTTTITASGSGVISATSSVVVNP